MWKFAKLGEIPEFAVDDPETLFAFWRHLLKIVLFEAGEIWAYPLQVVSIPPE